MEDASLSLSGAWMEPMGAGALHESGDYSDHQWHNNNDSESSITHLADKIYMTRSSSSPSEGDNSSRPDEAIMLTLLEGINPGHGTTFSLLRSLCCNRNNVVFSVLDKSSVYPILSFVAWLMCHDAMTYIIVLIPYMM